MASQYPRGPNAMTVPTHATGGVWTGVGDEQSLLAAIRAGDSGAFQALFTEYHAPLVRMAFEYVRDREVALEVVQDMFLHFWEQRAKWEVRDSLRMYLFAATRRCALNRIRRAKVEQRWRQWILSPGRDVGGLAPRSLDADTPVLWSELDEALRKAIAKLPERCRETFILSRQHGLSHDEIATAMGVSAKTVQVQIGRALTTLRKALAFWVE